MLKLCFKLGTLSRTFAILIQSAICEFIRKILYSRNSDWKMQREKKKKKMRKKEPSSCVRAILLKLMFFRSYDWFLLVSGYRNWCVWHSQYWIRFSTADFLTSSLVFIFGDSYKWLALPPFFHFILVSLPSYLILRRLLCLPQYPNSFLGHSTAIISLTGNWIIYVYPVVWSRPTAIYKSHLIFDNIDKWMIKGEIRLHKKTQFNYWIILFIENIIYK